MLGMSVFCCFHSRNILGFISHQPQLWWIHPHAPHVQIYTKGHVFLGELKNITCSSETRQNILFFFPDVNQDLQVYDVCTGHIVC